MWASQRVSSEVRTEPGLCSPYVIGVNAIFLPLIPYTIATAVHDTDVTLALILSTAFSGGILLLGLIFRSAGGYRTWPFQLEAIMLVVNAVLLGVSYEEEHDIAKYHNFIANSVYSAFGILSVMFTAPFTTQYVREFVPPSAATHDQLVRAAYATTSVWTVAFVANTLLYLVPICRDKDWDHTSSLNLVFRIILPVFIVLFAAIFTRIWPMRVAEHLRLSGGFDSAPRKVIVNPLAFPGGAGGMPPAMWGAGTGMMSPHAPVQIHAVAA